MALSDFQTAETIARSKRGTTGRNLGGNTIPATTVAKPSGGFLDKAGAVAGQATRMIGSGLSTGAKFVGNTAVDIGKAALGTARTYSDIQTQPIMNKRLSDASKMIDDAQARVVAEYKSGKMSKENYTKALKDISKASQEISNETKSISQGPSPQQRAMDIAETAVNVLTLGEFQLAKVGTKQAITSATRQRAEREFIEALVDQTSKNFIESAALKVPATRQLVIRNLERAGNRQLQKMAGETAPQFLVREGRHIAADLLIKRPLFYQANIGGAKEAYNSILERDYQGALTETAWMASQMLNGGPIGAFAQVAGWSKRRLGALAYGNQSYIDEISKGIGNGNPNQVAKFITTLKERAPEAGKRAEKVFRIMQEGNLRSTDNDVLRAAQNTLAHYDTNGISREAITPSMLFKDMENWAKADELWNDLAVKKGIIPGISKADAVNYTPVRWDAATRNGIAQAFVGADVGPQERMQILEQLAEQPTSGWSNNEGLMNRLREILATNTTGDDIANEIRNIDAAVLNANLPKRIAKQFADLGYTIAAPAGGRVRPYVDVTDTRKLISAASRGDTELFDPASAPHPKIAELASFLEGTGLSPEAATRESYRVLSQNVVANLDDVNLKRNLGFTGVGDQVSGGQVILSKLQEYVENLRPNKLGNLLVGNQAVSSAVFDVRQLTPMEIAEALSSPGNKISLSDARKISKSIMQGYLDVPLEFRGLGDKIVDGLYRYNPLQKYYSRVQSALRYTYNPFFRVQESVETALLSTGTGGSRLTNLTDNNLVWKRSREELDQTAKYLEGTGLFSSSLPGEAAQDRVLGRLTANITNGQRRDLAGLALGLAKSKGMTVDELIRQSPEELADALRIVVQYPNKGVLASSLARTMNVAFFPMRYNLKVTQIAGQILAKQPPMVQKAVLQSILDMRDWFKSDEGIRWQSENADAIQILKWATPIGSLQYTMNLLGHKPDSMSELGLLGGLPIGVITQLLDAEGIINLNIPYVNPKTGDVFPKYIPQSTKARASVALTTLLGSTFTYPGRILGLPGKEASIRDFVRNFIATNGSDFEKRLDTDRLTPLQQRWVEVLKGDTSKEALDALYNAPEPGQFNGYTIPPLALPWKQPAVERRTNLPKKASKAKGKKAKPTALPINTAL